MIREHLHQIFRLSCHGWNHHFPPFIKGRGELNNQNFCKKRGGLDSSHKKVGFGKIGEGGCFKKWGESLVIITNPFHCYLPLIVWCVCVCVCVCVFCLFTPFLLVLFVFHWKNLALLNLINIYMTSTSE